MRTNIIERFRSTLAVSPSVKCVLSHEKIEKLAEACSSAFGEVVEPELIELVANYCTQVGERISGRCAGEIEDIVVRFLFRYYASGIEAKDSPDLCHIEIGVLFGVGVICAHGATHLAGKRVPIVAIDPFEGYYGASVDPVSKLEVTEQRFRGNLAVYNIPNSDIRLVRGFSTDPAIFQQCRLLKALSVLIDGDHSYEGVLSDWRNFSPLVVPNGYVLLDDYNNPHWPEIARCVDREILPCLNSGWATRLMFGRSLLLQRTVVEG